MSYVRICPHSLLISTGDINRMYEQYVMYQSSIKKCHSPSTSHTELIFYIDFDFLISTTHFPMQSKSLNKSNKVKREKKPVLSNQIIHVTLLLWWHDMATIAIATISHWGPSIVGTSTQYSQFPFNNNTSWTRTSTSTSTIYVVLVCQMYASFVVQESGAE